MAQIITDLAVASEALSSRKLVAIPTETVYGLAANALDQEAVQAIFTAKNRPVANPLIIHVSSWEAATPYVRDIPSSAYKLADRFMPGPLTLLLPKTDLIPDIVTAGSDRVAVRVPSHPLASRLLQSLPFPLAAPSANPYGYISPTTTDHVMKQLGDTIEYILDGGPCDCGLESTIIGFKDDQVVLHRRGAITLEDLQTVVPPNLIRIHTHTTTQPLTSGMVLHHYSPYKPVCLFTRETFDIDSYDFDRVGVIVFKNFVDSVSTKQQIALSSIGDLSEAAAKLYQSMHYLDQCIDVDIIMIERLPDYGLGTTMNDRLKRASAPKNTVSL